MNIDRAQVIAWARQAFGVEIIYDNDIPRIERFAAFAYAAGAKDENEACAKAGKESLKYHSDLGDVVEAAIRARGKT